MGNKVAEVMIPYRYLSVVKLWPRFYYYKRESKSYDIKIKTNPHYQNNSYLFLNNISTSSCLLWNEILQFLQALEKMSSEVSIVFIRLVRPVQEKIIIMSLIIIFPLNYWKFLPICDIKHWKFSNNGPNSCLNSTKKTNYLRR